MRRAACAAMIAIAATAAGPACSGVDRDGGTRSPFTSAPATARPHPALPNADHHKHIPSPAAAALLGNVSSITADQLIGELDAAGIARAVVLSVAYWFGSPSVKPGEDEYVNVRAENDWTIQQASRFPGRLTAFCSFNPLRPYALDELERCATRLRVRGLKLHFNSSRVDLLNADHVEKVRRVFQAASRHRLAMVVHVRGDLKLYGREHAEAFVNALLPSAGDAVVQIAHLWGGAGFSNSALAVYALAVSRGDPQTRHLYFDIADIARVVARSETQRDVAAERIRQIGLARILWGSDMSPPVPPAQEAWLSFRQTLSLTDEEIRAIARNVAPYLQ